MAYPQNPYGQQQYSPPQRPDSTDTIAMILEIVFSLFGMMGMGWLYVGNFLVAIAVFIGYIVLIVIETFFGFLSGGSCICIFIPLNISVWAISGLQVREYVREYQAQGSIIYVIIAVVVALILLGVVTAGVVAFLVIFVLPVVEQLAGFY